MKYQVRWLPDAERELGELWLAAPDQSAFSSAANELDRLLAQRPNDLGESREQLHSRIAFVAPLAVLYHVRDDDRLVLVVSVWRFRTGGPR